MEPSMEAKIVLVKRKSKLCTCITIRKITTSQKKLFYGFFFMYE